MFFLRIVLLKGRSNIIITKEFITMKTTSIIFMITAYILSLASGVKGVSSVNRIKTETRISSTSVTVQTETEPATEAVTEAATEVPTEAPVKKEFTQGVSDWNVYTSDYAGIKITLPETAHFINSDDLYTHYMMPTRFMYDDEKKRYLTGVLDATASYGNDMEDVKSINVWFYDTKARFPENPDLSAMEFTELEVLNFTDIDVSDVSTPDEVTLCGENYVKTSYKAFEHPHIDYVRRIDEDRIMVIRTSGFTADEFESRLEAVN